MDISGFISTGHLISEAYLHVLVKVASRLGVTGVQVITNHLAVPLPFTVLGIALEDVNMMFLDIFNCRGGLEECIDG